MNTPRQLFSLFIGAAFFFNTFASFAQIDTNPQPYGGNQRMRDFICDEMIYPESAFENKVEGTVEVGFTVMFDGKKINYRIKESVSPELDKEALRICKLIMFHPAVKSSNIVISETVIPVKFNIKKYKRNCKRLGSYDYSPFQGTIDTSLIVYATKILDKIPTPYFKDPTMSFGKHIQENMKYPEMAYSQNMSGEVVLDFVVETSGRISNIEIETPLGGGCTEEALKLLKQIFWNPGIKDGVAVRSFMSASISFSLDNNTGHKYLPNNNNTTM